MIFRAFTAGQADLGYVLRAKGAKVLLGHPDVFKILSQGPFAQPVFSGVLSFSEPFSDNKSDNARVVTKKDLDEILLDLRTVMSIGGDLFRLYWLLVRHENKGRAEVHCLGVQVDLLTGKFFSIYVKRRDDVRLRAWQALINAKYGFSDPDAPAARLAAGLDPRIPNYAVRLAVHQRVQNAFARRGRGRQKDVVDFLEAEGFEVMTRYENGRLRPNLAIKHQGKILVLQGVFYEPKFNLRRLRRRKPTPIKKLKTRFHRLQSRFINHTRIRFGGGVDDVPEAMGKSFSDLWPPYRDAVRDVLLKGGPFEFVSQKRRYAIDVPRTGFKSLADRSFLLAYLDRRVGKALRSFCLGGHVKNLFKRPELLLSPKLDSLTPTFPSTASIEQCPDVEQSPEITVNVKARPDPEFDIT